MKNIFTKISQVWNDPSLRRRVLYTIAGLFIFQLLANIPIPGIDKARLAAFLANNQLIGLFNVFSGGGLVNLSLVMLGVSPYITASIIMQLLTMMFPSLKALYQEEGDQGRKKFATYTRLATVPLAIIQGFGFIVLLEKQGIIPSLGVFALLVNVCIVVGGSVLIMWIGELISEFGIGNGVSLIIAAGIISSIPTALGTLALNYNAADLGLYLGLALGMIAIIFAVVFITEAERSVPVTYAKQVRGNKVYGGVSTYLPLRLNQAGVIPIIFALSILLFPQAIFGFLANLNLGGSFGGFISAASTNIAAFLADQWVYASIYFVFVFIFTFFYTAVTFDPQSISKNLQQGGAFIPGVRPGLPTQAFLSKIVNRITLVGGLFLAIIAVLPLVVQGFTGITALTIGGTALLIVVSVVLDLVKKIDAQLSMREY